MLHVHYDNVSRPMPIRLKSKHGYLTHYVLWLAFRAKTGLIATKHPRRPHVFCELSHSKHCYSLLQSTHFDFNHSAKPH